MGEIFTDNQIKGYEELRSKILSVNNEMYKTDISENRYRQLIEEACKRSTAFNRRMEIKEELAVIRLIRRDSLDEGIRPLRSKQKDWKVVHIHCNLNNRFGKFDDPKPIAKKVFRFDDKHEAIKKFAESYKTFDQKSYDRETHSVAALKFCYEENGIDILTYLLLHYQNRQYIELTDEEFK